MTLALNHKPLHLAIAVSFGLHGCVGLSFMASTHLPKKESITSGTRESFQTYISHPMMVVTPHIEQEAVKEKTDTQPAPIAQPETIKGSSVPDVQSMEYRTGSFSRFGRSRGGNNGQNDSALAFQQRYSALQRRFEFLASSPVLQGECMVTASNDWTEVSIDCSESQDINFFRSELAGMTQLKESISGLKHCLIVRKNQVLKKENCATS